MNRRNFIKESLLATATMSTLNAFASNLKTTDTVKMPALFVGHGSPMNAIEENEFHNTWATLGKSLPRPKAILVVSAHWLTKDTRVTAMEKPQTIHDFGGFPQALFDQQYPAPGSPEFAKETQKQVTLTSVQSDFEWGLDHGAWSFLLPMYPQADIPVYQLSLDYYKPLQYHYDLAKQLAGLREKGVMIMGSGNIVHNLRMLNWSGKPYDWAQEFDQQTKSLIDKGDHTALINYEKLGASARLSVPTHDHYLPLIYILALQQKNEQVKYFNEKLDLGAVSMRSFVVS